SKDSLRRPGRRPPSRRSQGQGTPRARFPHALTSHRQLGFHFSLLVNGNRTGNTNSPANACLGLVALRSEAHPLKQRPAFAVPTKKTGQPLPLPVLPDQGGS